MALPAFITANPGLSLSIASTLAKLGSGLLGRNAAKDAMTKAEEENRKIMARANLRQAFGGNPSVDLVQPKLDPGFGTTLLSRLGDAAALASQAYGLYDAKKLRDLQMENIQGQIDTRKLSEDITRGTTLGMGAGLPQTDTIAPKLSAPAAAGGRTIAPSRVSPANITMGGGVAPPDLSDVGQAAFSAAQAQRLAGQAAARTAAQQQAFDNHMQLTEMLNKERDLDLRTRIFNDKVNNLGQLSHKDRMTTEKTLRTEFNSLTSDFRSVGDSFNTILAGADDPTAASDLSLIFAFMKMLDPRSTVRESEFAQAEQAGALPDRVQNIIGRLWDGERLKVNRKDFLNQAKNLYDARLPGYTTLVDKYGSIAGREGLNVQNVLTDYRVNLDRFNKVMKMPLPGGNTGGLTAGNYQDDLNWLTGYTPQLTR